MTGSGAWHTSPAKEHPRVDLHAVHLKDDPIEDVVAVPEVTYTCCGLTGVRDDPHPLDHPPGPVGGDPRGGGQRVAVRFGGLWGESASWAEEACWRVFAYDRSWQPILLAPRPSHTHTPKRLRNLS